MTTTDIKPYSMRLDPGLRAKLEYAAKSAGRSLHAEIALRLELSLKEDATSGMTEDRVRQLIREEINSQK